MGVLRHTPRTAIDPTAEDNAAVNDILAVDAEDQDSQNEGVDSESDNNDLIIVPPPVYPSITPSVQQLHDQQGRITLFRVRRTLRTRTPAIPVDTTIPPRSNRRGSKKLRRYENQVQLVRNSEENEFGEVSIDDFLPSGRTTRTFTKLLQQADKELWNNFLNPIEDMQTHCSSSEAGCSSANNNTSTRSDKTFIQNPEEAFNGLCRKLRNLLKKRHFPLGVVEMLEDTLFEFFEHKPQETYESSPLDSFRRGILHALSQYNNLRSYSVKSKVHEKHKQVLIQNNNLDFSPPSVRLVHYLEQKYHSRESL